MTVLITFLLLSYIVQVALWQLDILNEDDCADAADDDDGDELSRSFADNYHKREIKYEGFGGKPSVGGRPGARPSAPLNPALASLIIFKFD